MFHFVANLKPYTLDEHAAFDAYLLSIDYLREHAALAATCRPRGRLLVADNGNFDRIRALIGRFAADAEAVHAVRIGEERRLRRSYARPGELSAELVRRYGALVDRIDAAADEVLPPATIAATVAAQLGMRPSYLIGMEHLTSAAMIGLSIEAEYLTDATARCRRAARRAIEHAVRSRGEAGEVPVFCAVHAIDLDSATAIGADVADAGLDSIATGLGGALQDRSRVDFRIERGRVVELGRAVPRPYVRVMEIAAGLHLGFARARQVRPRFHALGVGAPILLPLLALLGDAESHTASDSTAPIVDGWTAPTISLYVDDPAPLKYKAAAIARHWLADGRAWQCACRSCSAFDRAHPPDLQAARAWWRQRGHGAIAGADLHGRGSLAAHLPLLGNHVDPAIRRAAAMARVGHNHEVLRRIELAIRAAAARGELAAWVDETMDRYLAQPGDPAWREAARIAHRIARAAHDATRDVREAPALRP